MCNICINSLTFISRDLNKLKELSKIVNEVASNKNANSIVALLDKHGYNTKDKMLLCDKRDYMLGVVILLLAILIWRKTMSNKYMFQAMLELADKDCSTLIKAEDNNANT